MSKHKAHSRLPSATQQQSRSAVLEIEPIRGRPMAITYKDGKTEHGQLMNAVKAGLELCRLRDARLVLAEWSQVKTARFVDQEPGDVEDTERFLAALKKLGSKRGSLPMLRQERPRTRAECPETRPCLHLTCRYHLYLDIDPKNGEIRLTHPFLDPSELDPSCALDVADKGGATLETVGAALNLTRERIRQIESRALEKLRRHRRHLPSL